MRALQYCATTYLLPGLAGTHFSKQACGAAHGNTGTTAQASGIEVLIGMHVV